MTRGEAIEALQGFLKLARREFHGVGAPDGPAYQAALRAVEVLAETKATSSEPPCGSLDVENA